MRNVLIFALMVMVVQYAYSQDGYFDLTTVLPKNYVKDGSKDYTELLQKHIDKERDVVFPDFPILINENGLKLKSNSNYKFKKNSKLIMKPNDKSGYNMLDCNGKKNINIYNAILVGDRKGHFGTKGEWGFGISVRGAKNICIEKAKIYDCYGDGIYIGRLDKKISDSIVVNDTFVSNSLRNGLSITSGTNVWIKNSKFEKSNGKGPSSGIDIEPNGSEDELKNIVLQNIETKGNENWGLLINLVNLRKENHNEKSISIVVNDFTDRGSKYGLSFWLNRKNNFTKNIKGSIKLNDIFLLDNKEEPIKFYDTHANEIKFSIKNLTVSEKSYKKLLNAKSKYLNSENIEFIGNTETK